LAASQRKIPIDQLAGLEGVERIQSLQSVPSSCKNPIRPYWLYGIPEIYTSNWVLGNHDNHRVATRLGPGNIDGLNMVKALLPGVAVTYNGEEIGQEDGEVSYEEGQDPSARDPAIFDQVSRDFERTPYQWDESVNAGFNTGAKPWLPVSENQNSPDFQGLYTKVSSEEAHTLVEEVRAIDEVQRLAQRLKDMGVKVDEALAVVYDFLGWGAPKKF
jgi:hypothetical protein